MSLRASRCLQNKVLNNLVPNISWHISGFLPQMPFPAWLLGWFIPCLILDWNVTSSNSLQKRMLPPLCSHNILFILLLLHWKHEVTVCTGSFVTTQAHWRDCVLFFKLYASWKTHNEKLSINVLNTWTDSICHKRFSYTAQKSVPWNSFYLILVLLETTENTRNSLWHECLSNLITAIRFFSVFLLRENHDLFFPHSFIDHPCCVSSEHLGYFTKPESPLFN